MSGVIVTKWGLEIPLYIKLVNQIAFCKHAININLIRFVNSVICYQQAGPVLYTH